MRKSKNHEYSALKAFFRQYELIYVAADERDVIKLRTNYRREQVYLSRLRTSRGTARAAARVLGGDECSRPQRDRRELPNCTSVIRQRVINAGGRLPFSWRFFANAYLPELLYRQGTFDTGRPLDFSARIREGLPMLRLKP